MKQSEWRRQKVGHFDEARTKNPRKTKVGGGKLEHTTAQVAVDAREVVRLVSPTGISLHSS